MLIIKAAVLCLLSAALAVAMVQSDDVCDSNGLDACTDALSACVNANTTKPEWCKCHKTLDKCLVAINCPAFLVRELEGACLAAGCPAGDCGGLNDDDPPPFLTNLADAHADTSTSTSACLPLRTQACSDALSSCLASSGGVTGVECACRGGYSACTHRAGCGPAVAHAVVQSCVGLGCPLSQCSVVA